MNAFWRLLPAVGLLAFATETAQAVPSYLCQKTAGTITVDGKLDEVSWKLAKPCSPLRDLSGKPSAYEADIRLTYDDRYLYVGAVLPAKDLRAKLTQRDSIIYHDDDFEVFLDPTGTGHNYPELEINALNTVWDLFLTAPYREGRACIPLHDWDIKGLKTAVTLQGTLNDASDTDRSWTVEIAWPWESITGHATLPRQGKAPAPGTEMRLNFSRVDHPSKPDGSRGEVNTVWAPTRQATIHAPEHWGRLRFSDRTVGTPEAGTPEIGLWVNGGRKDLTPEHFRRWADAGITAVVVDGGPGRISELCGWAKTAGLKTVAWFWTLNRPGDAVALQHPDWYAVSASGKSCHTKATRPFVDYYQFLCPRSSEARQHLKAIAEKLAADPNIDAVQMDYIRMPDLVLPKELWKNYGLDMSTYLPDYDFCWCNRCKADYRKATGKEAALTDAGWRAFREQAVADVANLIADTVRAKGKRCGAAVFPTPAMSADMVHQNWRLFRLDFALPMVYASFYGKSENWILDCSRECDTVINGDFPVYPGLFMPDFSAEKLREFLPRLLSAHPGGVCLFSHGCLKPEQLTALKSLLRPEK